VRATVLEHVEKASDVGFHIGVWFLGRISHTGLCGQIDHMRGREGVGTLVELVAHSQVAAHSVDAVLGFQNRCTRLFQMDVVVVVEVVEAKHIVATRSQRDAHVKADEASATSD
jgi:hypothetical protein